MLQRFWNVSLWQRLNSSSKCKCCQFNKGCHFLGESNVTIKKTGEIRRQNKKLKKNNYELRIIKEEEERERKNETCKKQRERK